MSVKQKSPHSWLELSPSALAHNVHALHTLLKVAMLAPAVKANAYGHGITATTTLLTSLNVSLLCVNSVTELAAVRDAGFTGQVIVLGPLFVDEIPDLVDHEGIPFVYGKTIIQALQSATDKKKQQPVILLIDTGMTRDGVRPESALERFHEIEQSSALHLQGLATHFATADEPNNQELFTKQLATFRDLEQQIDPDHSLPLTTLGNSATTLLHPEAHGTVVRPGISLYGLSPSPDVAAILKEKNIVLQPVLSWKTNLVKVTSVAKGSTISYGATYTTKRDSRIGLLPIGYYDGYDRHLSNRGEVLIRAKRAPIVGRVCMNMCMIDLTEIPEAQAGDEVVLIGTQGNETITADDLAEEIGTINYEVVTRLPLHVPRLLTE